MAVERGIAAGRAQYGRLSLTALLTFILFAVLGFPLASLAHAAEPALRVSSVDYAKGTVRIGARSDAGPALLVLMSANDTLDSSPPPTAGAEVSFDPYRLAYKTTFQVIGRSAEGTEMWRRSITVDPADYRPKKPKLTAAAGEVVPSRWTVSGTAKRPVTWVKAYVRQTEKYKTVEVSTPNSGKFSIKRVPVPYGPATIVVRAKNGFGSSPKAVRRVYRLGEKLPRSKRYVLLCKKTLWMYHVYKDRVVDRWPVAIGTPQTPTPSGTFRIGRRAAAAGDWGVLRRRLSRVRKGPNHPTRYYIHGTNRPSSIGMQASHGCVRMHNKHVRQFAKRVPNRTIVRIR
jgi:lipoprotein-anchoring transpeptidase ErfK/SrfK